MITLFRRIRQKLIDSGSVTKYLFYAVGEILLVVMGILLALQINTWNEERKFRQQQYGLLKDLAADLKANLKELESGREANRLFLDEYRSLSRAIREDQPSSPTIDSLCTHLPNWHSPFFTRTAYESLKNKGLEIVENDSLKQQIVALFEKEFVYLSEDYDRTEWEFASNIKTELLNKYLQFEQRGSPSESNLLDFGLRPVDFESMKADQRFANMLSELILYRSRGVFQYTQTIGSIKNILSEIETELKAPKP